MICKRAYPALLPAASLKNLKRLRLHGSYLAAEEFALLEECLKEVEGATWGPYRTVASARIELPSSDIRAHLPERVIRAEYPEVMTCYDGRREIEAPDSRWFEFTGKGAGRVKCGTSKAEARCREYSERYEAMKRAAKLLIDQERSK